MTPRNAGFQKRLKVKFGLISDRSRIHTRYFSFGQYWFGGLEIGIAMNHIHNEK